MLRNFYKRKLMSVAMKVWLILFGILFYSHLDAQYFGGNPAGQKWLQIQTDSVSVIFPKGMEYAAKRIINFSSRIQQNDPSGLGNHQR